jgi:hypothetical protein
MHDSQPDKGLFTFLLLGLTVPTAVSMVSTIASVMTGDMKVATFRKWAKLFALNEAGGGESALEPAPFSPWPRQSREEMDAQLTFDYAKEIEISNGRWAMLGFSSAILIEAATGGGVFQQLLWYARFVGLLGENSGNL